MIETVPSRTTNKGTSGQEGFIEDLSTTHRTQLRCRSKPVDLFSTKCGIVLHVADTSLSQSVESSLPSERLSEYTAMLSPPRGQKHYIFLQVQSIFS